MRNDNQSGNGATNGTGRGISSREEAELREIICALRNIPDQNVPNGFADMVIANLPVARKKKRWLRFIDWLKTDRTISFSPLKIAPAFALAVMLLLLAVLEKENHDTVGLHQGEEEKRVVSFVFYSPQAQSVAVVGSFNDWTPKGGEMRRQENGSWTLTLPLGSGRYSYVFLVNGQSLEPDPKAAMGEDDGFGTRNSILIVEKNNDTAI